VTLRNASEATANGAATERPGSYPGSRLDYLPGTRIEIIRPVRRERPPRVVLFDFDGTTSQIRAGWAPIMSEVATDALVATGTGEPRAALYELAHGFILDLAGRPTLHQMQRLADEVRARGAEPLAAEEYGRMYRERLMERVEARREALRGAARARVPRERQSPDWHPLHADAPVRDRMVVPGTFEILEALRRRGVALYLLSGTDRHDVIEEAALLGLDTWFGDRVHAPAADDPDFTKALGIQRILAETGAVGADLLGFGDGVVETRDVKAPGGTAVGVASDEGVVDDKAEGGGGEPDPLKRRMLIEAGADLVIGDYRECEPLLAYVWEKSM
jgi:phosphoglycolate phosphatase-like HAD superfamily hydrolase